ncbi:hypothetical protein HMPREF0653_01451 [Prevotella disiens JCM 6334 = ATCC 29426]|uniref:Uncharacterized protein n=1 Tax=Prevotella disiens JCM 6334 = ATCC 29426 TaxID=1235811 RepID=A0ABP2Y6X5_9BACT|nr:hypothetical protein HMPREF0653_01451 [Prevotella disiens JCM 6334 = ATCC 29426]
MQSYKFKSKQMLISNPKRNNNFIFKHKNTKKIINNLCINKS